MQNVASYDDRMNGLKEQINLKLHGDSVSSSFVWQNLMLSGVYVKVVYMLY